MAKVCPHCGCTKFTKSGIQHNSKDHSDTQRWKCKKCYKHFVHAAWSGSKKAEPFNDMEVEGEK